MVDEGCSPLNPPLFISFTFCVFFVFLGGFFVNHFEKYRNQNQLCLVSFPHPSILFRMVIYSHNRQRQKRVGMKTPKATRMGNMRLLLSEA